MGLYQSSIHVANASSKTIRARVAQRETRVKEIDAALGVRAAPVNVDASLKAKLDYSLDVTGFARIGPQEALEFRLIKGSCSKVYVSVSTADEPTPLVICFNFTPPRNKSVIVTNNGTVTLAKRNLPLKIPLQPAQPSGSFLRPRGPEQFGDFTGRPAPLIRQNGGVVTLNRGGIKRAPLRGAKPFSDEGRRYITSSMEEEEGGSVTSSPAVIETGEKRDVNNNEKGFTTREEMRYRREVRHGVRFGERETEREEVTGGNGYRRPVRRFMEGERVGVRYRNKDSDELDSAYVKIRERFELDMIHDKTGFSDKSADVNKGFLIRDDDDHDDVNSENIDNDYYYDDDDDVVVVEDEKLPHSKTEERNDDHESDNNNDEKFVITSDDDNLDDDDADDDVVGVIQSWTTDDGIYYTADLARRVYTQDEVDEAAAELRYQHAIRRELAESQYQEIRDSMSHSKSQTMSQSKNETTSQSERVTEKKVISELKQTYSVGKSDEILDTYQSNRVTYYMRPKQSRHGVYDNEHDIKRNDALKSNHYLTSLDGEKVANTETKYQKSLSCESVNNRPPSYSQVSVVSDVRNTSDGRGEVMQANNETKSGTMSPVRQREAGKQVNTSRETSVDKKEEIIRERARDITRETPRDTTRDRLENRSRLYRVRGDVMRSESYLEIKPADETLYVRQGDKLKKAQSLRISWVRDETGSCDRAGSGDRAGLIYSKTDELSPERFQSQNKIDDDNLNNERLFDVKIQDSVRSVTDEPDHVETVESKLSSASTTDKYDQTSIKSEYKTVKEKDLISDQKSSGMLSRERDGVEKFNQDFSTNSLNSKDAKKYRTTTYMYTTLNTRLDFNPSLSTGANFLGMDPTKLASLQNFEITQKYKYLRNNRKSPQADVKFSSGTVSCDSLLPVERSYQYKETSSTWNEQENQKFLSPEKHITNFNTKLSSKSRILGDSNNDRPTYQGLENNKMNHIGDELLKSAEDNSSVREERGNSPLRVKRLREKSLLEKNSRDNSNDISRDLLQYHGMRVISSAWKSYDNGDVNYY